MEPQYERKSDVVIADVKSMLLVHVEAHKTLDVKMDDLILVVKGNGKQGLVEKVDILYKYVYYVMGGAATVGILYCIISFVLPLILQHK
jgi:hypothetical protein